MLDDEVGLSDKESDVELDEETIREMDGLDDDLEDEIEEEQPRGKKSVFQDADEFQELLEASGRPDKSEKEIKWERKQDYDPEKRGKKRHNQNQKQNKNKKQKKH